MIATAIQHVSGWQVGLEVFGMLAALPIGCLLVRAVRKLRS